MGPRLKLVWNRRAAGRRLLVSSTHVVQVSECLEVQQT